VAGKKMNFSDKRKRDVVIKNFVSRTDMALDRLENKNYWANYFSNIVKNKKYKMIRESLERLKS
jgi:hypothetical protein